MKQPHKEATPEQLKVAREYRIPKSQAHTINLDKVKAYRKWQASEQGSVEQFLDRMGETRGSM